MGWNYATGADVSAANTATHTADTPQLLLEHHLKELRLPTILREDDKVARQSAVEQVGYQHYLLRMTELVFRRAFGWRPFVEATSSAIC